MLGLRYEIYCVGLEVLMFYDMKMGDWSFYVD